MTDPIRYIDSHTGGEPTRVIVEGAPNLGDGSLKEQRDCFAKSHDWLRSATVNEPRGYDAVVGALLCSPERSDSDFGVIFYNNVGYLGMCVHGTIGVAETLRHLGRIDTGTFRMDTPVGQVEFAVQNNGTVTVKNVPCYRFATGVAVTPAGLSRPVHGDIAWGGNWFFLVDDHGLNVSWDQLDELQTMAKAIRQSLDDNGIRGKDDGIIDHIELFGSPQAADAQSKNFVLCPGGEYDRSPCGTGTSAKLACLTAAGKLAPGNHWRQEGIVGSIFEGWIEVVDDQWIPYIQGTAHITADCRLIDSENDPFRYGIGAK